jgi:rubrerythrin
MNNQDLNFLDAIRMAIEAEARAVGFYDEAAKRTANPLGRDLLKQLADFERYHHTQLVDLEDSLCSDGACIIYEGRELDFPVPDEVERIKQADRMSAMSIIEAAIEIKRKAQERYAALAEQTTDPNGQAMFQRLAEEEQANRRILENAYWSLNNQGVWKQPEQAYA